MEEIGEYVRNLTACLGAREQWEVSGESVSIGNGLAFIGDRGTATHIAAFDPVEVRRMLDLISSLADAIRTASRDGETRSEEFERRGLRMIIEDIARYAGFHDPTPPEEIHRAIVAKLSAVSVDERAFLKGKIETLEGQIEKQSAHLKVINEDRDYWQMVASQRGEKQAPIEVAVDPREITVKSGKHLGAVRSWIQWNCRNGESVTWGSENSVGELTVRQLEELAQRVADAVPQEALGVLEESGELLGGLAERDWSGYELMGAEINGICARIADALHAAKRKS
jgi:hypothetical protein